MPRPTKATGNTEVAPVAAGEAGQRAAYGHHIEKRAREWRILRDANQAAAWEWDRYTTFLGWPAAVLPAVLAGGATLAALFGAQSLITASLALASAVVTATARFFNPSERRDGYSRNMADYGSLADSAAWLVELGVNSSVLPLTEIKKQFDTLDRRATELDRRKPLIARKHKTAAESEEQRRKAESPVAGPYPTEIDRAIRSDLLDGRFYKAKQTYRIEVTRVKNDELTLGIDLSYVLVNRTDSEQEYTIGITAAGPTSRYLIATIDEAPIDLERPSYRAGNYLLIPRRFSPGTSAEIRLVAECDYRTDDSELLTTFVPAADFELRITNPFPQLTMICEPVMRGDVEPTVDGTTKCYVAKGVLPYQGFRLTWHAGQAAFDTTTGEEREVNGTDDSASKKPLAAEDVSQVIADEIQSSTSGSSPRARPSDNQDRLREWRQGHRRTGKGAAPSAKLCPSED